MVTYKDLSVWEVNANIDLLTKYRNLIVDYYNTAQRSGPLHMQDNDKSLLIRSEMNSLSMKVHQALSTANISSQMLYSPAPAFGGIAGNIDLISNIFTLYELQIKPQLAIDIIEKALGVYEHGQGDALIRTFNPFYWIIRFINWFVSIPFSILGRAGFNRNKIEESSIGKFIKSLFYLITVLAAFLTVLNYLGLLNSFKSIFSPPSQ